MGISQKNDWYYFVHAFIYLYIIKRNIIIKAIDFIDYYVNQHVNSAEDLIIAYIILKYLKSDRFLENYFGFIYILGYVRRKINGENRYDYFVVLKFFFDWASKLYNEKKLSDGLFEQIISII